MDETSSLLGDTSQIGALDRDTLAQWGDLGEDPANSWWIDLFEKELEGLSDAVVRDCASLDVEQAAEERRLATLEDGTPSTANTRVGAGSQVTNPSETSHSRALKLKSYVVPEPTPEVRQPLSFLGKLDHHMWSLKSLPMFHRILLPPEGQQLPTVSQTELSHRLWKTMTVFETNLLGPVFLLLVRLTLLSVSVWLLYTDIELKGFNYMYYTTWGAYMTAISFFFLSICSLYKCRRELTGLPSEPPAWLWKWTAFSYTWALNMEFVVTFCFWLYLFVFMTDLAQMTKKQIQDKIVWDLFQDVKNYDHSLPLFLLLIEYCLNNIPFTWPMFLFPITALNFFYIGFEASVSVIQGKQVYHGINWLKEPWMSLLKSMFPIAVSLIFAVVMYWVTTWKVQHNSLKPGRPFAKVKGRALKMLE